MLKETTRNIAYGVSDFERIQERHDYYVDKTHFIPKLENNDYVFLIRPRRFGKSLWVSILETYYDVAKKDKFQQFFQGTWIGEHPTKEANSYLILPFNFSAVRADVEYVEQSFEEYSIGVLESYLYGYRHFFDEFAMSQVKQATKFAAKLSRFLIESKRLGLDLYIIIDEYDNFANTILATAGESTYHNLTHGDGFFRNFFSVLKEGTSHSGSALKRLFITGVSPITMDDVTSGFNIGTNLSLDDEFHEMVGFTEAEVRTMLTYYRNEEVFKEDIEETLDLMKVWYNGYRFGEDTPYSMFNTDMIIYFVGHSIRSGKPPSELIDQNIRIDYGKLRHLLLLNRQLNGNFDQLKEIIDIHETISRVNPSFPLKKLQERENFISLLYYFGLLGIHSNIYGRYRLHIPNLTVWHLMYSYIREALLDTNTFRVDMLKLDRKLLELTWEGNWQPFFTYLSEAINNQTSVRDYLEGEKVIQGFLLAYLYLGDFFIARSESEANKGYADIILEPFLAKYPDLPYGYLIELKYMSRSKPKDSQQETEEVSHDHEKTKEKLIAKAQSQLTQYLADDCLKHYGTSIQWKGLIMVWKGWELVHLSEVQPTKA